MIPVTWIEKGGKWVATDYMPGYLPRKINRKSIAEAVRNDGDRQIPANAAAQAKGALE